jgi:POT family proton-dependent oligopeptide transporter
MSKVTASERKKLWAALVFIIFSIIFWGIYEQSGGSLSIFAAKNLNKDLLDWIQMVLIIQEVLSLLFSLPHYRFLWIWLNKRKN